MFAAVQTLFIDLRAHNRAVRHRARQQLVRQRTIQDALQELAHDIQNLKYERNHYKREIQSSRTLPYATSLLLALPSLSIRLDLSCLFLCLHNRPLLEVKDGYAP